MARAARRGYGEDGIYFDHRGDCPWGRISAAARRRGRPRPANDSWIAACCLAHQFARATFNVKDFEDFAAHDGLQLITSSR